MNALLKNETKIKITSLDVKTCEGGVRSTVVVRDCCSTGLAIDPAPGHDT